MLFYINWPDKLLLIIFFAINSIVRFSYIMVHSDLSYFMCNYMYYQLTRIMSVTYLSVFFEDGTCCCKYDYAFYKDNGLFCN